MNEFEELLIKTARVLEKLEIPYIVTGGAAVVFWGRPRFTADIDIVVELYTEKIQSLVREFHNVLGEKAYIDEDMIRREQGRGGSFNIIDGQSGLKIDFFVHIGNLFEKQRLKRAVIKKINGQQVRIISPEDLILIKLLWYKDSESSRHLEDTQSIISIQGDSLDKEYLRQWAEQQGIADILNKII